MPTPHRVRLLSAAAAVTILLSACGTDSSAETTLAAVVDDSTAATQTVPPTTTVVTDTVPEITLPPRPPSDYMGFRAQPTACGADAPSEATPLRFTAPEDQGLDPSQKVTATISTSCGDIQLELDPAIAPETVNSFVFLARAGYFDGTVSHRIVPGFVIQAGDPSATGREGPGYTIPDELPEAGFLYERGVLAMANAGPNTTGSQFFIVLADAPLNPDFSVFGRVVDGFDTLDRIAAIQLGANAFGEQSIPLQTLYLESVTIAE